MDATIPAYGYLVKPMDPYRLERTVADALTGSSAKDRLEPQPWKGRGSALQGFRARRFRCSPDCP